MHMIFYKKWKQLKINWKGLLDWLSDTHCCCLVPHFLFLPLFDVICDLYQNKSMATFVLNYTYRISLLNTSCQNDLLYQKCYLLKGLYRQVPLFIVSKLCINLLQFPNNLILEMHLWKHKKTIDIEIFNPSVNHLWFWRRLWADYSIMSSQFWLHKETKNLKCWYGLLIFCNLYHFQCVGLECKFDSHPLISSFKDLFLLK